LRIPVFFIYQPVSKKKLNDFDWFFFSASSNNDFSLTCIIQDFKENPLESYIKDGFFCCLPLETHKMKSIIGAKVQVFFVKEIIIASIGNVLTIDTPEKIENLHQFFITWSKKF